MLMPLRSLVPVRSLFVLMSSFIILTGCSVGIDPTEDPVQPSKTETNEAAESESNNANTNANADANENINASENSVKESGKSSKKSKNSENPNNISEENFLNGGGGGNLFTNNQGGNNLLSNKGNNNLGLNDGSGGDDAFVNGAEGNDIAENNAPKKSSKKKKSEESTNIEAAVTDSSLNEATPKDENSVLTPEKSDSESATTEGKPSAPSNSSAPGVVRYVMVGGSKLHDQPQGDVVKELEQGDHPLVNTEGEWSRTSDGYYVPTQTLTAEPIGRSKMPKEWR